MEATTTSARVNSPTSGAASFWNATDIDTGRRSHREATTTPAPASSLKGRAAALPSAADIGKGRVPVEVTTTSAPISSHPQGAAAFTDTCSCKRMLGRQKGASESIEGYHTQSQGCQHDRNNWPAGDALALPLLMTLPG
eukprot:scaffold144271_cov28-Tisochrysis_lutea.AAC.1